jgi:hypothetical protein
VLKETADINMQTLTGSEPIFGRNLTGMCAEPVAQLTGANKTGEREQNWAKVRAP